MPKDYYAVCVYKESCYTHTCSDHKKLRVMGGGCQRDTWDILACWGWGGVGVY